MNIAYKGGFLRQGLLDLGHNVLDLPDGDINSGIKKLAGPIDLVILEPYGSFFPVWEPLEHETAIWGIDSPINEFWLRGAARLADHVFFDQRKTAASLAKDGLRSLWLPLCAQDSYFIEAREKIYDISFVGTVNSARPKRSNLLKLLEKYVDVNLFQGISLQKAQEVFAQSRITLNENFFDGLTLRVFQGLAAGSFVFTEQGDGIGELFKDGEDLAIFGPDNVLEKLLALLKALPSQRDLGDASQNPIHEKHTSRARAKSLLEAIREKSAQNARPAPDNLLWHKSQAMYFFIQRYGGNLGPVIRNFKILAAGDFPASPKATLELGNIYARMGDPDTAGKYFMAAAASGDARGFAKLALMHSGLGDMAKGSVMARRFLKALGVEASHCGKPGGIYLDVAIGYMILGQKFDPGFGKVMPDTVPDTALAAARMAWDKQPDPESMDLMLASLAPYNLEGELLPEILSGIESRALTKRQALRAAEIALGYYDHETADQILKTAGK